ncbi:MAG TPA: pyridoxal 5'-phosphate synthase glutaminase subunit PdxT [Candidatus Obscuribacterales bacterium]
MVTVGILSLQGDFAEHAHMLRQCGADTINIRFASELDLVDGLIIPGGESTTIARLTENNTDPIFGAICRRARQGMPIYGTCMGAIVLARQIEGSTQGRLSLMDITVRRNAFGPQKFSREQLLDIPALGPPPFPAVFIRAPIILSCGQAVEVLARIEEGIVMARQENLLVTAFHPEIAHDTRVHEYFLNMVVEAQRNRKADGLARLPEQPSPAAVRARC